MLTVLQGDCRDVLKTLPDESVHCVVTSPPYWGLRDYGVEEQLGLEATPEEYVSKMVEVFREVWRVLRSDGTLWLNLGDSYAGSWGNYSGQNRGNGNQREISVGSLPVPAWEGRERERPAASRPQNGIKPKDLIGIPWMVAFALRADGWYLRSEIIWHKVNPMPESVTDRPTKSHEQIFLLTKAPRYFYDQEAIREPLKEASVARLGQNVEAQEGSDRVPGKTNGKMKAVGTPRNDGERWNENNGRGFITTGGANKKTVWTVSTIGFKDAHFATFPPKLIEPCIRAGTSVRGCCAECGAPWERIVESESVDKEGWGAARKDHTGNISGSQSMIRDGNGRAGSLITTTTGWKPTCDHNGDPVPCTVLDPFAGSGTVGKVALELGRKAVMIELNPAYCGMIQKRSAVTLGLPGLV
jgi:DNA modification methylase